MCHVHVKTFKRKLDCKEIIMKKLILLKTVTPQSY